MPPDLLDFAPLLKEKYAKCPWEYFAEICTEYGATRYTFEKGNVMVMYRYDKIVGAFALPLH